jgi:hypothetical protein
MSARALLKELRGRGLELSTDGGRLLYRPKNVITPVLFDALRAHKPGLIKLLEWERRTLEEADRRGLVIRWSDYPKWIEMHDPLSGEWHEVRASECLPGVVETANEYMKSGGGAA